MYCYKLQGARTQQRQLAYINCIHDKKQELDESHRMSQLGWKT